MKSPTLGGTYLNATDFRTMVTPRHTVTEILVTSIAVLVSELCEKPKDTPASCALCGEQHTANYKGCTKHKLLQRSRNSKFKDFNQRKDQHLSSKPHKIETNMTLRSILLKKLRTHPQSVLPFDSPHLQTQSKVTQKNISLITTHLLKRPSPNTYHLSMSFSHS